MYKHILLYNYKNDTSQRDLDELTFQLLELKKHNEILELNIIKSNCKTSTKDYYITMTFLNEREATSWLRQAAWQKVDQLLNKLLCKSECFDVEL